MVWIAVASFVVAVMFMWSCCIMAAHCDAAAREAFEEYKREHHD